MKYEGQNVQGWVLPVDPEYFPALSPGAQNRVRNKLIQDSQRVQYAFTGIGSLEIDSAIAKLIRRFVPNYQGDERLEAYLEQLRRDGLVGDILYQALVDDGRPQLGYVRPYASINPQLSPLDERVVGLPPDPDLRSIWQRGGHVVAVAQGQVKVDAIKAAMKGRFIDSLVTDVETAKEILTKWP